MNATNGNLLCKCSKHSHLHTPNSLKDESSGSMVSVNYSHSDTVFTGDNEQEFSGQYDNSLSEDQDNYGIPLNNNQKFSYTATPQMDDRRMEMQYKHKVSASQLHNFDCVWLRNPHLKKCRCFPIFGDKGKPELFLSEEEYDIMHGIVEVEEFGQTESYSPHGNSRTSNQGHGGARSKNPNQYNPYNYSASSSAVKHGQNSVKDKNSRGESSRNQEKEVPFFVSKKKQDMFRKYPNSALEKVNIL